MAHGQTSFDKVYYKRFFREYSRREIEKYHRWFLGWVKFLDRYFFLKDGQGKDVLEVGCSIGNLARILNERGFRVIATDISSFIVDKARKLHRGIVFKKLDIEKKILPQKFDYVFAFETLEHLENPALALMNVYKMLKKGGVFVFSTPFPTKRSLSDPTHINVHPKEWWLKIGKKTGFRNRRTVYATFVPFLYRISKHFSFGFPLKTNIPYVNSTAFYFFTK